MVIFFAVHLSGGEQEKINTQMQRPTENLADLQTATLAGGCFWCVEADFEKIPGVIAAVSGYTGGATANPAGIGKGFYCYEKSP